MSKKTYVVGTLGLKQSEISVLKALFKFRSQREWFFDLVVGPIAEKGIDLFIVNIENDSALQQWGEFQKTRRKNGPCCALFISDEASDSKIFIPMFARPLRMTTILKGLDDLVVKDLHYMPSISDDASKDLNLNKFSKKAEQLAPKTYHHRVLVLDDSPTIQTLMRVSLHNLGIEAVVVGSGEEAQRTLISSTKPFDLCFFDVVLPGKIDGYKICKLVKSSKRYKHIPVIMLTSKNSPFDKIRGKMAGANSYLTKPVEPDIISQVLAKYLDI